MQKVTQEIETDENMQKKQMILAVFSILIIVCIVFGVYALADADYKMTAQQRVYSDSDDLDIIGKVTRILKSSSTEEKLVNAYSEKEKSAASASMSEKVESGKIIKKKRNIDASKAPCVDTDDGGPDQYFTKGSVSGPYLVAVDNVIETHFTSKLMQEPKDDYCNLGSLVEGYCELNFAKLEMIDCAQFGDFICFQGACIPQCSINPEICNCEDDNCDGIVDGTLLQNGKIEGACVSDDECGICGNSCPLNSVCQANPNSEFGAECVCLEGLTPCQGELCNGEPEGTCVPQCSTFQETCNCEDDNCDGIVDGSLLPDGTVETACATDTQCGICNNICKENSHCLVSPEFALGAECVCEFGYFTCTGESCEGNPEGTCMPECFTVEETCNCEDDNCDSVVDGTFQSGGIINFACITNEQCGSCNNKCPDHSHCEISPPPQNSVKCACDKGYKTCNGWYCDTNILTDEKNCGDCGIVCKDYETCLDGTCVCSDVGFTSEIVFKESKTKELRGIWGASNGETFAVGLNWRIVHYDGISWKDMGLGFTPPVITAAIGPIFLDVWGFSPDDVFAVGSGGVIAHYDGTTWSQMVSGAESTLKLVWGSSSTDVYFVDSKNNLFHYDGLTWKNTGKNFGYPTCNDLWGSSASDIYLACGSWDKPKLYHYDGSEWKLLDYGIKEAPTAIWGYGKDNVFIGTHYGKIIHYDGNSWTPFENPSSYNNGDVPFEAITGINPNKIFMTQSVGLKYYDTDVPEGGSSCYLGIFFVETDLWATPEGGVFGVGQSGLIYYFADKGYSYFYYPFCPEVDGNAVRALKDVWGSSPNDLFAVGVAGIIIHYDGNAWTKMDVPLGDIKNTTVRKNLQHVWGFSPDDVYATSDSLLLHYDGQSWKTVEMNLDQDEDLLFQIDSWGGFDNGLEYGAIWGSAGDDVYVVANNYPVSEFKDQEGYSYFDSELKILHFDGNAWFVTDIPTGVETINDIWGIGKSNVYAVGYGYFNDKEMPTLLHYNGMSWEIVDTSMLPSDVPLSDVSFTKIVGTSDTNLYITTFDKKIYHFDGTTFTMMNKFEDAILDIYITPVGQVFVITNSWPHVSYFFYDGEDWNEFKGETTNDFIGLTGFSDEQEQLTQLFAVGYGWGGEGAVEKATLACKGSS